jgi:hypothetical protein
MGTAIESSVDLPVVVAILFEDVPQEHQLGLQAVFIKESSGPGTGVERAAYLLDR